MSKLGEHGDTALGAFFRMDLMVIVIKIIMNEDSEALLGHWCTAAMPIHGIRRSGSQGMSSLKQIIAELYYSCGVG
jgi:hypothetical protein